MDRMRVLILGGTTEGSALAQALAQDARFSCILSYAGRTRAPRLPSVPCRIGGFGGVDGLVAWLRAHDTDAVVDATHPFAAQITRNSVEACTQTGTALLRVERPAWQPEPGDRWRVVPDMQAAVRELGTQPRRVLLTIGQKDLAPFQAAPWHHYLVRAVDPPPPEALPPGAKVITATGPFTEAEERVLLADRKIEVLVTKNSGGSATRAKLDAARALGCEVVMIARPEAGGVASVADVQSALDWLAHRHASMRGV
jgi:precorrin-6A/cobalt-precorrin-6A reductase